MRAKPKLLQSMRDNLRLRCMSPRTEEAYTAWVRRFVRFHRLRHPAEMGAVEIKAFLTDLAVERRAAPSTITQATAALLFLYREVLRVPITGLGDLPRPRQPTKLPAVLTRDEVRRVVGELSGTPKLVTMLLYGSGVRLLEALTLRLKDVDLDPGELRVRRGKGARDRVTVLPELLRGPLAVQIERVKARHARDCEEGRTPAGWRCRTG